MHRTINHLPPDRDVWTVTLEGNNAYPAICDSWDAAMDFIQCEHSETFKRWNVAWESRDGNSVQLHRYMGGSSGGFVNIHRIAVNGVRGHRNPRHKTNKETPA